jgi:hypothetical protein
MINFIFTNFLYILLILNLFSNGAMAMDSAAAVIYKKAPNESDKDFVARVTKQPLHDNQLGHSTKIILGRDTLVAFTDSPFDENQPDGSIDIVLNLFIPKTGGEYESRTIIACENEGGSAEMKAFFYTNLESKSNAAVGVICSWSPHNSGECAMNDEVRFFKIDSESKDDSLDQVKNEKFKVFYTTKKSKIDKTIDCNVAKFKTVSDVKRMLKEIGFDKK